VDGIGVIGSIIGLIIFVYMAFEVWRSPMATVNKVLWTIFSFLCTLIALIVWLVVGKRKAYGR
jgi:uncharacterized protein with PQ loop repeat